MDPIILTQTGGYFLVRRPGRSDNLAALNRKVGSELGALTLCSSYGRSQINLLWNTHRSAARSQKAASLESRKRVFKTETVTALRGANAEMLVLSRALPGYYQHFRSPESWLWKFSTCIYLVRCKADRRFALLNAICTSNTFAQELASVPNARSSVPSPRT